MSHHRRRCKPPGSLAALAHQPKKTLGDLVHDKTTDDALSHEDLNKLAMQLQYAMNQATHEWRNRDGIVRDSDLAGGCVPYVGNKVIDVLLKVKKRTYNGGLAFEFEDGVADITTLRTALSADNIRSQFQIQIGEFNRAADAYNAGLTEVISMFNLATHYNDTLGRTDKAITAMAETAQKFLAERMRGTGAAKGA